jgi:hypothetical protein
MSISYKCNHCGHTGRAENSLAGKIATCPKCKGSIEVTSKELTKKESSSKPRPTIPPKQGTPPAASQDKKQVVKQLSKIGIDKPAAVILFLVVTFAFMITLKILEPQKAVLIICLLTAIAALITRLCVLGSRAYKAANPKHHKVIFKEAPKNEFELLQSINDKMSDMQEDIATLRKNVGCIYIIITLFVVLSVLGWIFSASQNPAY